MALRPTALQTNRNMMDEAVVPGEQALVPEVPDEAAEAAEAAAAEQDRADMLDMLLDAENIAEELDSGQLGDIGAKVVEGFDLDKTSRAEWEENYAEAMELARQLYERKTWGGLEVANVKYPIIGTAAIHFNARTYGNLVKGDNYVNVKVLGPDPGSDKRNRAERVRMHMNYQLGKEMESWEEDTDQLLISLPLVGCGFKKTYFDFNRGLARSEYVSAEDLVVNYWARSLEQAPRVTHIIELNKNEVLERIRGGLFLDISEELTEPTGRDTSTTIDDTENPDPSTQQADEDAPHVFLEQHCWIDLDDDEYKEPYVVTVDYRSQKVVRVTARFDSDSITRNEKKQIVRIEPVQYFTQFSFFPAFDGNFYRMGFGILLAPVNKTINTVINQLLDAGTLANRQSGFINQGLRLTKSGASGYFRLKPGEWKYVQSPGDDIRKNIFPIPIKEPSTTLFQLLGLLLEASERLAAQTEVLSGEQTQPNVPATTTLALIEQGLKVYSSIYKRLHRAQTKEFIKLRRINYLYTDNEIYNRLLDDPQQIYHSAKLDYADTDMDIAPVSGSADISDIQRLIKAQALIEVQERFGLDQRKVAQRYLEALQIPDAEGLWPEEQPPNYQLLIAERQLAQADAQIQQRERELDLKEREVINDEAETYEKMVKTRTDAIKNLAIAEGMEQGQQLDMYKAEVETFVKAVDAFRAALEQRIKANELEQGAVSPMAQPASGQPGSVPGAGSRTPGVAGTPG